MIATILRVKMMAAILQIRNMTHQQGNASLPMPYYSKQDIKTTAHHQRDVPLSTPYYSKQDFKTTAHRQCDDPLSTPYNSSQNLKTIALLGRDAPLRIPYYSRLGWPLQAGQTLDIRGRVKIDAQTFSVNFWQGGYQMENCKAVVFHVKFRFNENVVVMNTYQNEWGNEESVGNPLHRGEGFSIKIRVHEKKYQIWVNQILIAEYGMRIPIQLVDYLSVEGEITLDSIHWGGRYYTMPIQSPFNNGLLKIGDIIFIHGIPNGNEFTINFLNKAGNILFHFNVRFYAMKIVRNARISNSWGDEERGGEFPFQKGVGFDLEIINEPSHLQIAHNGVHLMVFAHRTKDPGNDYVSYRIEGNLEVTDIQP